MEIFGVAAAVALAAVFVVSGVSKLVDYTGTREAVAGFGVPLGLAGPVARVVPPIEIVAALLILVPTSRAAGLGLGLLLLAGFTAAVVFALATGRRPDCHCFGRLGGSDVSGRTLVRNMALLALGVSGLVAAGRSASASVSETATGAVVGVAAAGLVVGAEWVAGRTALQRREREAEEAFSSSSAAQGGDPVDDFRLPSLSGQVVALADLLAPGRPVLLVFLSPGCGPCRTLRPAVTRWAEAYPDRLSLAVVASGGLTRNQEAYEGEVPILPVLLDDDDLVRVQFGVPGTPAAVLIGPDGRLRGGVASGERLVRRLLAAGLSGVEPGESLDTSLAREGMDAADLELSNVPRPRLTVTAFATDDGTVLIDEADGASVALDQIGGIVWSVLDGSSALEEIVVDLAEAFDAPVEVVGPDVLELVRSLGRAGMLEGVAPEAISDEVDTTPPHAHVH